MNGQQTAPGQTEQDLLAEIFGSSAPTSTSPQSAQPQQQRSTVDDILGLFGSTNTPSAAPASSVSPSPATTTAAANPLSSLFSNTPPSFTSPPAQSQPAAPVPTPTAAPAQPASSRLTVYTAYDKNDFTITLTPQTSPARPGIIMILAKFTVQGSLPASGINFQAAVPKVNDHSTPIY